MAPAKQLWKDKVKYELRHIHATLCEDKPTHNEPTQSLTINFCMEMTEKKYRKKWRNIVFA